MFRFFQSFGGYCSTDYRVQVLRGGEDQTDRRTWHLVVNDEYWQTFATKRDAIAAANRHFDAIVNGRTPSQ